VLSDSKAHVERPPRFNKATLFSWLMLLVRAQVCEYRSLSPEEFAAFLDFFEEARAGIVREIEFSNRFVAGDIPLSLLFAIYESRSSARVADVSSVILRDAILWLVLEDFARSRVALQHLGRVGVERIHAALKAENRFVKDDDNFAKRLIASGWGQLE
jgi:hypothetical protein